MFVLVLHGVHYMFYMFSTTHVVTPPADVTSDSDVDHSTPLSSPRSLKSSDSPTDVSVSPFRPGSETVGTEVEKAGQPTFDSTLFLVQLF